MKFDPHLVLTTGVVPAGSCPFCDWPRYRVVIETPFGNLLGHPFTTPDGDEIMRSIELDEALKIAGFTVE